jgi:hypothetical protein
MLAKKILQTVKFPTTLPSTSARSMYVANAKDTSKCIDLRSDTVTRPSKKMYDAMQTCQVGDDVYGDDLTTNEMQRQYAKLFGKEDALFMASGTMSNLVGMMLHAN